MSHQAPARTPWFSTGYATLPYLEMEPKVVRNWNFQPWHAGATRHRALRFVTVGRAEHCTRRGGIGVGSTWRDAPGTGQAFFTHDVEALCCSRSRRLWSTRVVGVNGRIESLGIPPSRRRWSVPRCCRVAPRAGRQPDRRRRRCSDRRRGRRFDRLLDRPPLHLPLFDRLGGSETLSAPVMSRLLNGCSTDGESEPCVPRRFIALLRIFSFDRSLAP